MKSPEQWIRDAIPKTLDLRSLSQGPYLQNVRTGPDSVLHSRQGLGVVCEFDSYAAQGITETIGPSKRLGTFTALNQQVCVVETCTGYLGDTIQSNYNTFTRLLVWDPKYSRQAEYILQYTTRVPQDQMPYIQPATWMNRTQPSTEDSITWVELDGIVIFGSPTLGLWSYNPTAPTSNPSVQQTHTILSQVYQDHHAPQGESCVVQPLTPVDGPFTQAYSYRQAGELPSPTGLTTLQGRLVLASQRQLYFSDPYNPQWWTAENATLCPSSQQITAVANSRDLILVWTEKETWAYQPPLGQDILAAGQWTRLSETCGCPSPQSVTRMGPAVVWAHQSGVWAHAGGLQLIKLSDPLDPFFQTTETEQGGIEHPLNLYYLSAGQTNSTVMQPPLQWNWETPRLTYLDTRDELILSFPTQCFAFVLKQKCWMVWQVGSVLGETSAVQWTNNLPDLEFIALHGEIYAVSRYQDTYTRDRLGVERTRTVNSCVVLHLGRGGALDRTETTLEDRREFVGGWVVQTEPTLDSGLWFGKPVSVPTGFQLPNQTTTRETWMVPMYHLADRVGPTVTISASLFLDNTRWRPAQIGATAQVDFLSALPLSSSGFGLLTPVATAEFQTYTGAAVDPLGNKILIKFDGNVPAPGSWDAQPSLNHAPAQPQLLGWIPMQSDSAATASDSIWQSGSATLNGNACQVAYYQHPIAPQRGQNLEQAVDWAVKTDQQGDGKAQLKFRGILARFQASGRSTQGLNPTYPFGLLNIQCGSDYKEWATQVQDTVDPVAFEQDLDHRSLRDRLVVNSVATKPTLDNAARWSSNATPTDGNFLSGSAPVDTIATSESIRGDMFSVMMYGCIQDPAETIALEDLQLEFRVVGGRRRQGR